MMQVGKYIKYIYISLLIIEILQEGLLYKMGITFLITLLILQNLKAH